MEIEHLKEEIENLKKENLRMQRNEQFVHQYIESMQHFFDNYYFVDSSISLLKDKFEIFKLKVSIQI